MALHDYYCPHCGLILVDQFRTCDQGGLNTAPLCSDCQHRTVWIPQTRAMDTGGVKGAAFKAFETYDSRNRKVVIDSLRKLRQVERQSEIDARNGEGQPLIFRRWSQDQSNADTHAIHGSLQGGEQPTRSAAQRFGKPLRASEEPDVSYGPGVSDANATALPLAGGE